MNFKQSLTLSVISLLLVSVNLVPGQPPAKSSPQRSPRPLRRSNAPPIPDAYSKDVVSHDLDCGANSLYVFLCLNEVPCSLDEIKQQLPTTEHGSSMEDLKKLAIQFGVEAVNLRLIPSDLMKIRLPAIARMSLIGNAEQGHYVVVTAVNDEGDFTVIDGTTGILTTVATGPFGREFSGYALVSEEGAFRRWAAYLLNFGLGLIISAEGMALLLLWRSKASPSTPLTPVRRTESTN